MGSAWVKVRYADGTTRPVGRFVNTRRFGWVLFSQTQLGTAVRSSLDASVVDYVLDKHPEVTHYVVHLKGRGQVLTLPFETMRKWRARETHEQRWTAPNGCERRQLRAPQSEWGLVRVTEPFVTGPTPTESVWVTDKVEERVTA